MNQNKLLPLISILFFFSTSAFSQVKREIHHLSIFNTIFSFKMMPILNLNLSYEYQKTDKFGVQADISLEYGTESYIDGSAMSLVNVISIAPKYSITPEMTSKRGHLKQLFGSISLFGVWDTGASILKPNSDGLKNYKVFPLQIYVSPQLTFKHIGKKGFTYQAVAGFPLGLYTPDYYPLDYDLYQKKGVEFKFSIGYQIF